MGRKKDPEDRGIFFHIMASHLKMSNTNPYRRHQWGSFLKRLVERAHTPVGVGERETSLGEEVGVTIST